jgi:hypothetical protein
MSLFAHIFGGEVLDPQPADDLAAYRAIYHDDVIAAWDEAGHVFKQVPEGTEHNAKDNGDGTYTNPVAPLIPARLASLSKLEFMELVQSAGGMTDAQLVAAHNNAALAALWIKFDRAPEQIHKDHPLVAPGLAALAALGYIPNGAQALLDAWPEA